VYVCKIYIFLFESCHTSGARAVCLFPVLRITACAILTGVTVYCIWIILVPLLVIEVSLVAANSSVLTRAVRIVIFYFESNRILQNI
jgi:hypothetical protein